MKLYPKTLGMNFLEQFEMIFSNLLKILQNLSQKLVLHVLTPL